MYHNSMGWRERKEKGSQREPKRTKGSQMEAKEVPEENEREPKGSQREQHWNHIQSFFILGYFCFGEALLKGAVAK